VRRSATYSCDVKKHTHNGGPTCWTAHPTKLPRRLFHRQLASRLSRTRYSSDIPSLHLLCPFSGAPTYMVANVIVFPVLLVLYSWARWWVFFGSLFCVAVVRFIHPSGLILFVAIAHKSTNVLAQPLLLLRAFFFCDVCMPSMWCAPTYPTEPRVRAGVCAGCLRGCSEGSTRSSRGRPEEPRSCEASRADDGISANRPHHTTIAPTTNNLGRVAVGGMLHARVLVCSCACPCVCGRVRVETQRQETSKPQHNRRKHPCCAKL
jgi:hypothetical protein